MKYNETLVPAVKVAEQFGITRRTLGRWIVDPGMAFPAAVDINGRLYFAQSQIEAWKLARATRNATGGGHRQADALQTEAA